jgi:hypothetical protein
MPSTFAPQANFPESLEEKDFLERAYYWLRPWSNKYPSA